MQSSQNCYQPFGKRKTTVKTIEIFNSPFAIHFENGKRYKNRIISEVNEDSITIMFEKDEIR